MLWKCQHTPPSCVVLTTFPAAVQLAQGSLLVGVQYSHDSLRSVEGVSMTESGHRAVHVPTHQQVGGPATLPQP